MSTISLRYSEVDRVPGLPVFRTILVLSALVTLAILLAVSTLTTDPTGRTAISQSSAASLAVPIPAPAPAGVQTAPAETEASRLEMTSEPSVVPVPVPAPPVPQPGAR